ncbi:MAG: tetratricopeptide repeat protein [Pyrinomonadaceae bacterium]|nr:tetratricopeptide repeat protein [Pyrinomonadaceae bacterium]
MKVILILLLFITSSSVLLAQTNDSQEFTKIGFSHFQSGQHEKAIEFFDKAIKLNPQAFDATYYRGISKLVLRKPLEAISDFNTIIAKFPNAKGIEETYQLRGTAYYFLNLTDKALENFEKAISINPNHAESYHGRANVLSDKGENEKALADYNKANQLKPHLTVVYVDRAVLYFTVGKFNEALSDYDKAIQMTPNVAAAYVERGIIKGILEKPFQAIEDIAKGYWLESNSVVEKRNESSTSPFIRLNRYILDNPQNYRALQMRAVLRLFQNNQKESEKDFKLSEELNSNLKEENLKIIKEVKIIMTSPPLSKEGPKVYQNPKP